VGLFVVTSDLFSFSEHKNKFILVPNDWNDYWNYQTLYTLYYIDNYGHNKKLGEVKIADSALTFTIGRRRPNLLETFDKLDDNYFSIGQSKNYYLRINKLLDELPVNPLEALQDMAFDLEILERYRNEKVTRTSLLRSVTSTEIRRQFHNLANGGVELTEYNFSYVFDVDKHDIGNESKNEMVFNVDVDSTPPTNIHVIIGRNGVGKSQILSDMINAFLDNDEKVGCFINDEEFVGPPYKIFPNLIYMSYTPFDNKAIIEDYEDDNDGYRYIYLGLKKPIEEGLSDETNTKDTKNYANKTDDDLSKEFASSFFQCIASNHKKQRLKESINILQSDPIFKQFSMLQYLDVEENDENFEDLKKVFKKFSSGHGIILLTITKLIETVEEKSLVLLDEPETHLHPPLLSSFVTCLSNLLTKRNAVAIVATHSPVILQEVPKKCVWKLNRSRTVVSIFRPRIETFGESYSSLVEEVFGLEIDKSGYHSVIREQVEKSNNYEEFLDKFDNQLGSDADVIARTLFLSKKGLNTNEN